MLWDQQNCQCGAREMDDCVCCPTCYTPQGDGRIQTNGCDDDNGCGLNRYEEAKAMERARS